MGNRTPHTFIRVSPVSGRTRSLTVECDTKDLIAYNNGALIQDVMPYLTPAEREFILTGITDDEWDNMFGEEVYEAAND